MSNEQVLEWAMTGNVIALKQQQQRIQARLLVECAILAAHYGQLNVLQEVIPPNIWPHNPRLCNSIRCAALENGHIHVVDFINSFNAEQEHVIMRVTTVTIIERLAKRVSINRIKQPPELCHLA